MSKKLIIAAVVVVALVALYMWYQKRQQAQQMGSTGTPATPPTVVIPMSFPTLPTTAADEPILPHGPVMPWG